MKNITDPIILSGDGGSLARVAPPSNPLIEYEIKVTTTDNAGNVATSTYTVDISVEK